MESWAQQWPQERSRLALIWFCFKARNWFYQHMLGFLGDAVDSSAIFSDPELCPCFCLCLFSYLFSVCFSVMFRIRFVIFKCKLWFRLGLHWIHNFWTVNILTILSVSAISTVWFAQDSGFHPIEICSFQHRDSAHILFNLYTSIPHFCAKLNDTIFLTSFPVVCCSDVELQWTVLFWVCLPQVWVSWDVPCGQSYHVKTTLFPLLLCVPFTASPLNHTHTPRFDLD